MQMSLTAQEEDLLRTILNEHHKELLREIAKADTRDFKQDLKQKAGLLESILNKLAIPSSPHV
jgi:hypothetical protein